MTTTQQPPTSFAITQQTDPDLWDWSDEEKALLSGPAGPIVENILRRLDDAGFPMGEAYGIIHDKDEQDVWDPVAADLVRVPKARHIHCLFKVASRENRGQLEVLAQVVGLPPQYLEKPGRGGHAYANMQAYLVHIKYPDKYQYDPAEVATVRGPDYAGVYATNKAAWIRGRATVQRKRAAEGLDDLVEKCFNGEVTREQIMLTDEYARIYSQNKRPIDDALDVFGQRRATRAAVKMRNKEFSTSVVFVTGTAGSGKTRFALDLIEHQLKQAESIGERWDVYRAATSNVLDDWNGQEVLLLDDLRAASMSATEWLLLLDPENASPASARYKNKQNVAPRLIVITSVLEPVEFFFYVRQRGNVDEALDQFIRRLSATVTVYKEDDVRHYVLSHMGEVPEYKERVETRQGVERVTMTQGAVRSIEVLDGHLVAEAVAGDVAARSKDLRLPLFDMGRMPRMIEAPRQVALPVGDPFDGSAGISYNGPESEIIDEAEEDAGAA